MNITLKQIRAFRTVAETSSFTGAATRLHVTQSALSTLIRELEDALQIRLFNRTTRAVSLTEAGAEFFPYAEKALDDLGHAVNNLKGLAERRRGRVTIATPPMGAAVILPPAIAEFGQRYPGIHIVLQDLLPEQIVFRIREGLVDCGVGPFSEMSDEGLERILLFRSSYMVVFPAKHALARKRDIGWRDLRGWPMIAVASVKRDLESAGVLSEPMIPTFEVSQMITALGLVGSGLGIAIVPSWMAPLVRLYPLVGRKVTHPKLERGVALLTRPQNVLSPAARSFVDHLKLHLSRSAKE